MREQRSVRADGYCGSGTRKPWSNPTYVYANALVSYSITLYLPYHILARGAIMVDDCAQTRDSLVRLPHINGELDSITPCEAMRGKRERSPNIGLSRMVVNTHVRMIAQLSSCVQSEQVVQMLRNRTGTGERVQPLCVQRMLVESRAWIPLPIRGWVHESNRIERSGGAS